MQSVGSLCEVINELDLEKYLEGLVNAEFSSKWSDEATGAQVVAARTYALYQMRQARQLKRHFDLDATVRDQVYDGSMKEDFRASQAVTRTRGLVLTVGSNQAPTPIKAFYHSTCGGATELPENVWGARHVDSSHGSLRLLHELAADRLDTRSARARSGRRVSACGARDYGPQPGWPSDWLDVVKQGKLVDLRAQARPEDGRVTRITTVWAHAGLVRELPLTGARFRDWVGPGRFRSTAFNVQPHRGLGGSKWVFQGRGNGHGVGMCQWGAKVMGERGSKCRPFSRTTIPT